MKSGIPKTMKNKEVIIFEKHITKFSTYFCIFEDKHTLMGYHG